LRYGCLLLRKHGPSGKALRPICTATTINRNTYAAPTWWRFACTSVMELLRIFLGCLIGMGFPLQACANLEIFMSRAEHNLFKSITVYDQHVLRSLLLQIVKHHYNLRQRTHDIVLPSSRTLCYNRLSIWLKFSPNVAYYFSLLFVSCLTFIIFYCTKMRYVIGLNKRRYY